MDSRYYHTVPVVLTVELGSRFPVSGETSTPIPVYDQTRHTSLTITQPDMSDDESKYIEL